MATLPEKETRPKFLDKATIRSAIERANAEMGFVPVAVPDAKRARALMQADGIRPEENLLSRGIIAAREERR